MKSGTKRDLTPEELAILREIRSFWGPQNSIHDVFFSNQDEAALFVKARNGSSQVVVVLTNLGRWVADGTLSKFQVREQLMGPISAGHSRFYTKAIWML